MSLNLKNMSTETRNQNTMNLDIMTPLEVVTVMNNEDAKVPEAIKPALPNIAQCVTWAIESIENGGRIVYMGAGTSGRLGVLDASECPPTYGVSPEMVVGIIAGGDKALRNAIEGVEDDANAGRADLEQYALTPLDSVIGLSVAGGAAYVIAALEFAKENGALTVAIACNEDCKINQIANIAITPDTGAEVVTGSTRMKAGTAQKMILNMISTGVMIKYGRVYQNYMVHIKPVNIKLRGRMIRIVSEIAEVSTQEAEQRLETHNWDIKAAVELG